MKGYTYILQCADGTYYTGSTKNLDRRLSEHQSGEGANYTRKRLPVELVYYEEHDRIDEAFRREHKLKKWSQKKKQALIERNYDALPPLSECQNESHSKNKGKEKVEE
jgi:putative endonuclease